MSNQLRIGVLIPAYNAQEFIRPTLESIASQTRLPEEIVVVDDGSSDATAEIVRDWSQNRSPTTRLICQNNKGASAARNTGIDKLGVDLVAFLDADDLSLPNRLELLETAFQNVPDLVCCFADAEILDDNGEFSRNAFGGKSIESLEFNEKPDGLRIITGSVYRSLLQGSYIPTCSSLVSMQAIRAIGGFDEELVSANDRDFFMRLSVMGQFAYFPVAVSKVRRHSNNLTHERNKLRLLRNRVKVLRKMLDMADALGLTANEINSTELAARSLGNRLLYAASGLGMGHYLASCQFLWDRGLVRQIFNPKHLSRTLYYSFFGNYLSKDNKDKLSAKFGKWIKKTR